LRTCAKQIGPSGVLDPRDTDCIPNPRAQGIEPHSMAYQVKLTNQGRELESVPWDRSIEAAVAYAEGRLRDGPATEAWIVDDEGNEIWRAGP
jgi:hypothetical protein